MIMRVTGQADDGLAATTQVAWSVASIGPDQHTIVQFFVKDKWADKISKVRVALLKQSSGETVAYLDVGPPPHQVLRPGAASNLHLSDQQMFGRYVAPVDAASGYQSTFYMYMNDGDFDGLNRLFNTVNHDDARSSDGDWTLGLFEDALKDRLEDQTKRSDAEAKVRRWITLQPKSMAAQFANAIVAVDKVTRFADHLADKTDKSAPKMVHDAALLADRSLQQMSAESKASALWWTLKIELVAAQGSTPAAIVAVYHQAAKLHPRYGWTTFAVARALARQKIPDWPGIEGIAQEARLSAGGAVGDEIYARTVIYVDNTECGCQNEVLAMSDVDWQVLRTGMLGLIDQYPSPVIQNQLASYACRAGDRDTYNRARDGIKPEELAPSLWISGYSPDLCEKRFNRAA